MSGPETAVAVNRSVDGHRPGTRRWQIVAALAVTQTVGYGVLYYTFAVLLRPMAASLHASTTAVTGALTASVLAAGAMAVPVGRWLDRHGGRALMTTGSILATVMVVAWSRVQTVGQLYVALIGIGITAAMVLYEPAFAVVVSWFAPPQRARALLAVIVVAGFASTIFMPLTAVLAGRYGWRTALLTLAALYGAVTIPLHACVIRRPPRPPAATRHPSQRERTIVVQTALRDRRFWWLGIAFVAHGAAMSTMTVHLVGFLVHKGHPATFAATVAGLLGVLSVTGRLLLTAAQRRLRLTTVVAAIFTIQAGAAISLPIVGHSRIGAAIAIVAFGIGFGAASLVTPILLAERYGTTAYATIAGTLTTPVTLAKATAPLAAAGLLGATGYLPVLAAISASCLLAAVGITARASSPPPGQRGDVAGPATSAIPAGAGSRDGDADLRRLH